MERNFKVYKNGPGHFTKMATIPIYGKNLQKSSPTKLIAMIMKLVIEHYVLKLYKVYINDDPVSNLTHFTTMSNLAKLVFVIVVGPDIR